MKRHSELQIEPSSASSGASDCRQHPTSTTGMDYLLCVVIRAIKTLILVGLFFPIINNCARANSDFQQLLMTADSQRTGNQEQFRRFMSTLDGMRDTATKAQQLHLDYLKLYLMVFEGKNREAITAARTLLSQSTETSLRFRLGLFIVNTHALTRNFPEGLRQLDSTLQLMDQISDKHLRHHGMIVASIIYNQMGQYQLAQRTVKQILSDQPNARNRCFAGNLYLETSLETGKPSHEDAQFHNTIDDCDRQDETIAAHLTRTFLARSLAHRGHTEQALATLRKHRESVNHTGYQRLIDEFDALLASFLIIQDRHDEAQAHAKRVINSTEGDPFSRPRVSALHSLYKIELARGNIDLALKQFVLFAAAEKAYLTEANSRELAFHLAKQDSIERNNSIALSRKQDHVARLEQALSNQFRWFVFFAAWLISLSAAAYWGYRRQIRVPAHSTKLFGSRAASSPANDQIPERHPIRLLRSAAIMATNILRCNPPDQCLSQFEEQRLRAMVLQVVYGMRRSEQIIDHLTHNPMFRWFIGTDEFQCHEPGIFEDAANRLLASGTAQRFFAVSGIREAIASTDSAIFSVDAGLLRLWLNWPNNPGEIVN